ncbi:MAG: tetratricopeptide repeat protein [Ramlibacter sp.]
MSLPGAELPFLLPRQTKVLMVLDVVESVRLMEQDEDEFVQRWQRLVAQVEQRLLPLHGGRLVKSLGDGLMLEFANAQGCVKTAFALQEYVRQSNGSKHEDRRMYLRVGANLAEFVTDRHDIYGAGVNLTARITTLAGPGEIVVTAELRDHLTGGLDADIEDLGDCHLKHVNEPVRLYRLGPVGHAPVIQPTSGIRIDLRPTIAVIPFAMRSADAVHEMLGEALADELIASLSRTSELHVISRLSTTAFRARHEAVDDIRLHLDASYLLTGTCRCVGNRMSLFVELVDTKTGHVVWADNLKGLVHGIFEADDDLLSRLISAVSSAVMSQQLGNARNQALPTLEGYTLLLGSVGLMHRTSFGDFDRARQMLEHLSERCPRHPIPLAWLAKWYVMRAAQGWSADPIKDAQLALYATRRALDMDPDCSLALTVEGMVHSNLLKELGKAKELHAMALEKNPNESLAWLFTGIVHAFAGDGAEAFGACEKALRLSPLDPLRYYYDALASSAAIAAQQYSTAIRYATRSLRANSMHLSSYRSLAIAQSLNGQIVDAQTTVKKLLALEPSFSVSRFVDRYPGADSSPEYTRHLADALRQAGLPEQ